MAPTGTPAAVAAVGNEADGRIAAGGTDGHGGRSASSDDGDDSDDDPFSNPSDYYRILQLDRDASPDAVRKAYRREALRHHPDKNVLDPLAPHRFQLIARAYEVLSDPRKRAVYDRYGARGLALLGSVPFLDPDVMLAFHRLAALGFFISLAVLVFPILVALKVDARLVAPWVVVFIPAYAAVALLLLISLWASATSPAADPSASAVAVVGGSDRPSRRDYDKERSVRDDEDRQDLLSPATPRGFGGGAGDIPPRIAAAPRLFSSALLRALKVAYVALFAAVTVLLSLRLDSLISSWPIVFAPWFLMELYHIVWATLDLLDRIAAGKVVPAPRSRRAAGERPSSYMSSSSAASGSAGGSAGSSATSPVSLASSTPGFVVRPLTPFERFAEVFSSFHYVVLRISQAVMILLKLCRPNIMTW
ncbi:hypothetical protein HK405_005608, partial [Cladochytrium tenue]